MTLASASTGLIRQLAQRSTVGAVGLTIMQGYLARLQGLSKEQAVHDHPVRSDTIGLLNLMRDAGMEVVEAIVKWRCGVVMDSHAI